MIWRLKAGDLRSLSWGKMWFENRTLLEDLPLVIFPRYSAKTNDFRSAKALLESVHSDTVSLSAVETLCVCVCRLHGSGSPAEPGLLLNLMSWGEKVSRGSQADLPTEAQGVAIIAKDSARTSRWHSQGSHRSHVSSSHSR